MRSTRIPVTFSYCPAIFCTMPTRSASSTMIERAGDELPPSPRLFSVHPLTMRAEIRRINTIKRGQKVRIPIVSRRDFLPQGFDCPLFFMNFSFIIAIINTFRISEGKKYQTEKDQNPDPGKNPDGRKVTALAHPGCTNCEMRHHLLHDPAGQTLKTRIKFRRCGKCEIGTVTHIHRSKDYPCIKPDFRHGWKLNKCFLNGSKG